MVVGRSNIVGMPAAMLLNKRDATVTIAHSRTKDIAAVVRTADIIIAAAGQPEMIKKDWVKPGAVIIDVGTNPVDDATKKTGYRCVPALHPLLFRFYVHVSILFHSVFSSSFVTNCLLYCGRGSHPWDLLLAGSLALAPFKSSTSHDSLRKENDAA